MSHISGKVSVDEVMEQANALYATAKLRGVMNLRYASLDDYEKDVAEGMPSRALLPGMAGYSTASFELCYVMLDTLVEEGDT